jgi:thiamine biosynthesis lipoprotein
MTPAIQPFRDQAMATHFEVRLAGLEPGYAGQAAQACFERIHALEAQLSRFRPRSEIRRAAALRPGETMRLGEETFHCLEVAQAMEAATAGAFSVTAGARKLQGTAPRWSLSRGEQTIRCESGCLEFDLGAIGKGFALDRIAELLREWECPSYLLVAGGSSILAGDPPPMLEGWSCGLGDDDSPNRILLRNASLSGSGLAVKGSHILDPRTGSEAAREARAWALCDSAAESDALSTAAMVLDLPRLGDVLREHPDWLVWLEEDGAVRPLGQRCLPVSGSTSATAASAFLS